jgi:uncharacterized integral membrane protein
MYRLIATTGLTLVMVLFALENSQHVPISLIIGAPAQVRLVFLLLIAAGCGFLFAYMRGVVREIKMKKEIRRLNRLTQAILAEQPSEPPPELLDE